MVRKMINLNNKKCGFSLFEACVTMLIVAIFTALCANTYTKRHVKFQESDGHGRYECYKQGTVVKQRYVENGAVREITTGNCVFRPPRYAKYILINSVAGGSLTNVGKFESLFFTSLDAPINITPANKNGATEIRKKGILISKVNGPGDGSVLNVDYNNELDGDCEITAKYDDIIGGCLFKPICRESGDNIEIDYCNKNSDPLSTTLTKREIKINRDSQNGNIIKYKDLSMLTDQGFPIDYARAHINESPNESLYTITLKFKRDNSTKSQMQIYLDALGITDGIAMANPGAKDSPGGVLILW